jgi:glycosyltransferase involved in cell wall biosynthesis
VKILLVSDSAGWAVENRCKAIKKFLPKEYYCDILNLKEKKPFLDWNEKEYDIIHFHCCFGIAYHKEFIEKHAEKIILTSSNERTLTDGKGGNPKEVLEIVELIAASTSVSKSLTEKYGNGKIKYIPNGIDEDLFCKHKKPVIGYAGTDNEVKNLAALRQACEDLGLELKTALKTGKVDNRVVATVPYEEMQDFYNSIDVYVHTSYSEGCNNTILEALAGNVPVLMTKVGLWQELEGYVTFIEPTINGVKEALKKFLGRRLIEEKFLWKNIVSEYEEVYKEVELCLAK